MSKFKIGLLIVFGAFILIAVVVFATAKSGNNAISGHVSVWGVVDPAVMGNFLSQVQFDSSGLISASYTYKDPENFDFELAENLANGTGPDIILISQDMLFKHKNKILTVPYKSFDQRLFKETFIDQAESYLTPEGEISFPFLIDPIIMYWNKDIFKNYSIITPPKYWDEFLPLSEKMSIKDKKDNITDSLVSFGEWRNVSNAKAILSTLFLQSGLKIVDSSGRSDFLESSTENSINPAQSVLNFYTQFANPTNTTYSWNRSLPKSINFFLGQNLATYFGFASEIFSIRNKNPNINFDISTVPQPRQNKSRTTFAKVYSLSIVKQSKNIPASFLVINKLISKDSLKKIESLTNLPPVRRDMLSDIEAKSDSRKAILYDSAIFSKNWFDLDRKKTDEIFQNMVESVTSGRNSVTESINSANQRLDNIYEN